MIPSNQVKGTEAVQKKEYLFGFTTDIETEILNKGLNESVIELISQKKNEPKYILDYRLKAYKFWKSMKEPEWGALNISKIDYQNIHYYAAPKNKKKLKNLDELDPKLKETYDKLGLPISEQKRLANVQDVAIDLVFDSVSLFTTFKDKLKKQGIIFCSIQEAMHKYPELLKKYLGSVVPHTDNFYASLNSAVFSDGSFVYIPPNTRCPMDLSTYFRINTQESGQFERTIIICDENSYVSYLEGCSAPSFNTNQLHAAVVELIALNNSEIKYSTIQNWYAGDPITGKGGIYNFVTKRGLCKGDNSKISWTQIETGAAITWKYPSCILKGENSIGEFYSVALTNHKQQADTGTKMIHIGANTKSSIISKGISADEASNTYRGSVQFLKTAKNAKNYTQCDSMLIGQKAKANTYPYIISSNSESVIEHEATTSRISEDQLLYLQQRGIKREDAIALIINGFCKNVFQYLPLEFAVEASKLLTIKLENSVG